MARRQRIEPESNPVVIVGPCRTPIGKFQGRLAEIPAPRLGAVVVTEVLKRTGLKPEMVDELIMGNVLSAGLGQNPARQVGIFAGLPVEVGSFSVNKVCGSGLKAIMLGAQSIRAGDSEVVIAGGMENMSAVPYYLPKARNGLRMGHDRVIDGMIHDGLWDAYYDIHMGETGDIVAEKFGISRADQDEFALRSHQRALKAIEQGRFKDEIVPVEIPSRKGETVVFDTDEGPRADTTIEGLARLRPYFKSDGTVTAGNSSQINDAASAMALMREDKAKELGLEVMGRILGYGTCGVEPTMVMIAPVPTTRLLMEQLDLKIKDLGLVELNEAFSSQPLAVSKELGLDQNKLNVHGGAVALGHPIGATGARLTTTLLHLMKQRRVRRGLVTMCLGGGNGVAMVLERL